MPKLPTKILIPKPDPKKLVPFPPVCIACGDTGKASNGGPCIPCLHNGRIK